MYFIDVETIGFYGLPITIQYALGDESPTIYDVWFQPVDRTLELIEKFVNVGVCGFNLAFDWFHLCKLYTTLDLLRGEKNLYLMPDVVAIAEFFARDGKCLKPSRALDLMLVAKTGPLQQFMNRRAMYVKRIPTIAARELAELLEARLQFDPILFARSKKEDAGGFRVVLNEERPALANLELAFKPSLSLKALAKHVLGVKDTDTLDQFLDLPEVTEYGYAPFAFAHGYPTNVPLPRPLRRYVEDNRIPETWNGAWPQFLFRYATYWQENERARRYALNDVNYTRQLYKHFDCPPPNDVNSQLAVAVAATRWKGFKIDRQRMLAQLQSCEEKSRNVPTAPEDVRRWLKTVMSDLEFSMVEESTSEDVLMEIATWEGHPASEIATKVLTARAAQAEAVVYEKLLLAGRFHASFNVIGAKSSRMSGSDALNPQAIKRDPAVRKCFPMAFEGELLSGGDFDAFEVALAAAEYEDPDLTAELLKCTVCNQSLGIEGYNMEPTVCGNCGAKKSGKKIHALFAMDLFGVDYDTVMKSKGTSLDMYSLGKQGVFAMIYGGDANTLAAKLNVPLEKAEAAEKAFYARYPNVARARQATMERFAALKQPKGPGTKVFWTDPDELVTSKDGFSRYFTLEVRMMKALYEMATDLPKELEKYTDKVVRFDREQKGSSAIRSALYGAAFAIQGSIQRAAGNHKIQSLGATKLKDLQVRIWNLQPTGIEPWRVRTFNVHDELLVAHLPDMEREVRRTVSEFLVEERQRVPLIKMIWGKYTTWGDKG